MDEPINVENKTQARQKPPRNLGRIACEILAGAAAGIAVALPAVYVIGALFGQEGCFGGLDVALGYLFFVVPPVYGLGSAVGVYLVGNIGKQTGSFLLALGGGFLGGLIMPVMLPLTNRLSDVLIVILFWLLWPLVLLIPPIMATCGFNSRRRYKEPTSS